MSFDTDKILAGDKRQIAKAITLIESKNKVHRKDADILLNQILPHTGKSLRIGISGVPGVGKSTFIECLGNYLISEGHKVAVLAVDPSSPLSGGSIMGDKTRMEKLSQSENAFIRPSPAGKFLGGVASKTRESMLLCEAAGFDIILVETVGVGQSEHEVANMVDCFILLMLPNAGDEVQGIKKGIIELTDFLIINKADGDRIDSAKLAKSQYENALGIISKENSTVMMVSSLENKKIKESWDIIFNYCQNLKNSGELDKIRKGQEVKWMEKIFFDLIDENINNLPKIASKKSKIIDLLKSGEITPYKAATDFFKVFKENI